MYELKKIVKVLTSKSVGTGPSSDEKRIYRAAVSQRWRNTDVESMFIENGSKKSERFQFPCAGGQLERIFQWQIILYFPVQKGVLNIRDRVLELE